MRKFIIFFMILCLFCFSLPQAKAEEILTWEDCLAEANKNNPDLISALENLNQQKANKSITASTLYPQVDANLDASRAGTSNTIGSATTKTTTDTYTYGLSGTQLIFDGFKTTNKVKSASESINAAQHNYSFASSKVRLNLRTAFINLLKAQELIKVAEEIVNIRKNNLMLINMRYESGLEHKGALLTAEANLAQANFDLAQTKRNIESAQWQLTKEMGRQEFKPMFVSGEFAVNDNEREKPKFEILAKNNPSLLQAGAKKSSAAFDIKSAYGDFAPKLSATGGANKKSGHWPPENNNWNVGLSLTLPIFEGGLRSAQVSKAKAAYNQLEADERSIRDSIIVALEQSWVSLQDALETVDVQHKFFEAAEERSKISSAQYSAGFITFDNWILIENDLVKVKKSYLDAQANALLAEANWIYEKGETLEYAQK